MLLAITAIVNEGLEDLAGGSRLPGMLEGCPEEEGVTLTAEKTQVIPREALERFWERAPLHDREASFFEQDFQELKQAGYLRLAVPEELGGLGRNLALSSSASSRGRSWASGTSTTASRDGCSISRWSG